MTVVSSERMTIEQSPGGHWLVTLQHTWSDTQRITFTVEVERHNQTLDQLREAAVRRAADLLLRRAGNPGQPPA
jgi:hypothetical protein